ncbi:MULTISPECIES: hypothetical protein [Streptomyces]|uniref:hypothetical protein n=1 Tax=Streptomyces TaxID=1883 RepID=UPI000D526961|nr:MULTISPECIES: hypothetical protein [Streptomyces]AWE51331.1 hypothetical protein DC008_17610 [Streptomyces nigra]MCF2537689.1 hypothetical protein [Streptomyces sp. FB2]
MKRQIVVGAAVGLLLVAGCTGEEGSGEKPQAKRPSAVSQTPKPKPTAERGPGEPLGATLLASTDAELRKQYEQYEPGRVGGHPDAAHVAVLRGREKPWQMAQLVWMSDSGHFCWMAHESKHESSASQCSPMPTSRPGVEQVHTPPTPKVDDGWYLAVVENAVGRFGYTGRSEKALVPVRQATVRFPSGRTVTFVSYGRRHDDRRIPWDAEICDADRSVCFDAFDRVP